MKRALAGVAAGLLFALAFFACVVDESFPDDQFKCDPNGGSDECPPGLECTAQGLCRHTPAKPGSGGTGSIDGCFPKSCSAFAPKCGIFDDSCGSKLNCDCVSPFTCGGGFVLDECGCMPKQKDTRAPDAAFNVPLGIAWKDVDNVKATDDLYATSDLLSGKSSATLKASAFGFKLPAGITVTGIAIDIERSASVDAAIKDNVVRLFLDAKNLVSAPTTAAWSKTDEKVSYGGPGNLWGEASIKPSAIEDSTFGVAMSVTASADAVARVDQITVTVFFDNPACDATN